MLITPRLLYGRDFDDYSDLAGHVLATAQRRLHHAMAIWAL